MGNIRKHWPWLTILIPVLVLLGWFSVVTRRADRYIGIRTTFISSLQCFLIETKGQFPASLEELLAHDECAPPPWMELRWFDLAESTQAADVDLNGWVESQKRYVVKFSGDGRVPWDEDFRALAAQIGQMIHDLRTDASQD